MGVTLPTRSDVWCLRNRDDEQQLDDICQKIERLNLVLTDPEKLLTLKNERGDDGDSEPGYENVNGVAVIRVEGRLIPEGNWISNFFGMIGWNQVKEWYRQALADPDIKGIKTKISSGGGSWAGQTDCLDWLRSMRGIKPMEAFIEGAGCSAAMALAMHHDIIQTSRDAEVGSLGTVVKHWSYSGPHETLTVIRSGNLKAVGCVAGETLTDEAKQVLVDRVMAINDMFLTNCSEARPQNSKKFLESLQGADFLAAEALEKNLIDGISTWEESLGQMQERFVMDKLLKALGVSNETEGLTRIQNLVSAEGNVTVQAKSVGELTSRITETEQKLEQVNSVLNTLNMSVTKLQALTGQPSVEQAVATVDAWKLTVDAAAGQNTRIRELEAQNVDIRMEQLLKDNAPKMTADIKSRLQEQRELAQAAGKDPVAICQSFLSAVSPTLDLTNVTAPSADNSLTSGNMSPLTEDEKVYYKNHFDGKKIMTIEEYHSMIRGK